MAKAKCLKTGNFKQSLLHKNALIGLCLKKLTCSRGTTYRFPTIRLRELNEQMNSEQEKIHGQAMRPARDFLTFEGRSVRFGMFQQDSQGEAKC